MTFPKLPQNNWRSERPYIVTLVDGDRLPAYPVLGKISDDEEFFSFGELCQDQMWIVTDPMILHPLITHYGDMRILKTSDVSDWEPIATGKEVITEKSAVHEKSRHHSEEFSP